MILPSAANFLGWSLRIWFSEPTLCMYEGWNFNSGNYLFTTDTK